MHEGARAEPVGTMIREICFPDHKQTGHVAHQIIIHPEPAHGVVHRWVNPHWHFVGIFAGYFFVNLEQIAVALANYVFPKPFDRIRKIEVNTAPAGTHAAAFVANFLRCT